MSEKSYHDLIAHMNELIIEKEMSLKSIPNLFNTNREIFNSNHFLIQAVADTQLGAEQSKNISQLPNIQL
jgi:hypothetical protein